MRRPRMPVSSAILVTMPISATCPQTASASDAFLVGNVYKPKGMTRYGWRKQHEQRAMYSRRLMAEPSTGDSPHRL